MDLKEEKINWFHNLANGWDPESHNKKKYLK